MVEHKEERRDSLLELPGDMGITLCVRGEEFLGVGAVSAGGLALRSPARAWRPLVVTGGGINYGRWRLRRLVPLDDGGVDVVLDAIGLPVGIMEEQDEYLGDVVNLALPDEPVTDTLHWEFQPSTVEIDGAFSGFKYRFRFVTSEPTRAIYRLFDHATWEVGGHLAGNTLLLQGQVNPPVTALSRETSFTTACNYYGAEMRRTRGSVATGVPVRMSFQRLPRVGTLQAFDMLVHAEGALVGLFEPMDEIFSVVQTVEGEDVLHVVDEYRRPLSQDFQTPWKHMVVHRPDEDWSTATQRNLWRRVYDHVHDGVRARAGVRVRAWRGRRCSRRCGCRRSRARRRRWRDGSVRASGSCMKWPSTCCRGGRRWA